MLAFTILEGTNLSVGVRNHTPRVKADTDIRQETRTTSRFIGVQPCKFMAILHDIQ